MFRTVEEIRELSSFNDLKALSDAQIEHYIDRADAWIVRATNNPIIDQTDNERVQKDLGIATFLLVEYLWLWDHPELKEEAMSHDEVIRIGSYTVNKKTEPRSDVETGVDELDSILKRYRYKPLAGAIFQVLRKD